MMPSAVWRTPCVPTPWMSKNNTNARSRTCKRLTAKRCWSCAPEKNCSPCWARTRSDRDDPPGTEGRGFYRLDLQAVPVVRNSPAHGVLQADEGGSEDQP